MKTWQNLPSSVVGCSDMKYKRPALVKQSSNYQQITWVFFFAFAMKTDIS